jgi:hypothetical protein
MRRWVLRILVCLILGAITTVAVAWGIVTKESIRSLRGRPLESQYDLQPQQLACNGFAHPFFDHILVWPDDSPRSGDLPPIRFRKPLQTLSCRNLKGHFGLASLYGWPCRALFHAQWGTIGWTEVDQAGLLNLNANKEETDTASNRWLFPVLPLWPGFAIDTLFFAAIWFGVFFGFASGKRAIRRKRGRCLRCGYDLRGDLAAGCSECGSGRQGNH